MSHASTDPLDRAFVSDETSLLTKVLAGLPFFFAADPAVVRATPAPLPFGALLAAHAVSAVAMLFLLKAFGFTSPVALEFFRLVDGVLA